VEKENQALSTMYTSSIERTKHKMWKNRIRRCRHVWTH